jgi:hypothetical protein
VGFDWSTPYRIQVLFNQSGTTQRYDAPWASNISLGNEMVHLYLYNYVTGEIVTGEEDTPYFIKADFLNGVANAEGVKGTLYDCFWKTVTGRRIDLRLDNIAILEGILSVTDPEPEQSEVSIVDLSLLPGGGNTYQSEALNFARLHFQAVPGAAYGLMASPDLLEFTDLNTFIPGAYGDQSTVVEVPVQSGNRYFVLKRITR